MMEDIKWHQKNAENALETISNICKEHGITLYLLAGSCLGAVRHKGFIPWDDDIDVGIRNEEYHIFEKAMRENGKKSGIVWINNDTSNHYQRFYGKIIDNDGSPLIDVFRLVKLPENKRLSQRMWRTKKLLYKLLYRKHNKKIAPNENILFYWISLMVSMLISEKHLVKLARWNENRFTDASKGDYINLYSVYSFQKELIRREWIDNTSEVCFEGKKYITMGDTDAYLSNLYGDYMKLPPIYERKRNHNIHFEV